MIKKSLLIAAMAVTTGCGDVGVEPQGTSSDLFGVTGAGKPSLNYVYDELFPLAAAEAIAKGCPRLNLSTLQEQRLYRDLEKRVVADGFSANQFNAIVRSLSENRALLAKTHADQVAFLKKHGIVENDPDSICAAGRSEMQAESKVGSYLRATG